MRDQEAEQRGFGLGKLAAIALGPAYLATIEIDEGMSQPGGMHVGRTIDGTPQHRLDASEQFARREWLYDIVVGPHLQPAHTVVLGALGRQNNHRQLGP